MQWAIESLVFLVWIAKQKEETGLGLKAWSAWCSSIHQDIHCSRYSWVWLLSAAMMIVAESAVLETRLSNTLISLMIYQIRSTCHDASHVPGLPILSWDLEHPNRWRKCHNFTCLMSGALSKLRSYRGLGWVVFGALQDKVDCSLLPNLLDICTDLQDIVCVWPAHKSPKLTSEFV